jgi:DNA-binding IclR family transcriptional regulator
VCRQATWMRFFRGRLLRELRSLTNVAHASRYMFGSRLVSLGNTALPGLRLRERAAPFLSNLMVRTRLTTHLGIMENHRVVGVAKFDLSGDSSFGTWIGKRMDLHGTGDRQNGRRRRRHRSLKEQSRFQCLSQC